MWRKVKSFFNWKLTQHLAWYRGKSLGLWPWQLIKYLAYTHSHTHAVSDTNHIHLLNFSAGGGFKATAINQSSVVFSAFCFFYHLVGGFPHFFWQFKFAQNWVRIFNLISAAASSHYSVTSDAGRQADRQQVASIFFGFSPRRCCPTHSHFPPTLTPGAV